MKGFFFKLPQRSYRKQTMLLIYSNCKYIFDSIF
jgi:hypothetical protein